MFHLLHVSLILLDGRIIGILSKRRAFISLVESLPSPALGGFQGLGLMLSAIVRLFVTFNQIQAVEELAQVMAAAA